jgi:hypothetical protein
MRKEAVRLYFKVLSKYLVGETEKNHEKLESGHPFSRMQQRTWICHT